MRTLLKAILLSGILSAMPAMAEEDRGYDLFLLACDTQSDCQRVANLRLGNDGQQLDTPTPGVSVRVEILSSHAAESSVRLHLDLAPVRLHGGRVQSGRETHGQLSFLVDAATVHRAYYSPIAVFTGASRIYQLWGRLDTTPAARNLALK